MVSVLFSFKMDKICYLPVLGKLCSNYLLLWHCWAVNRIARKLLGPWSMRPSPMCVGRYRMLLSLEGLE
jgi:hypothetical protein